MTGAQASTRKPERVVMTATLSRAWQWVLAPRAVEIGMKSTFSEFYKSTDEELQALWNDSLFVIDANVVLNLYRYPINARDDLLKALDKVSARLWMPFQAALEYQRKRLDVIAEQKKAFDTVNAELKGAVSKIEGLFNARHPLIAPGQLVSDIKGLISTYTEQLQPLSNKQPAAHEDDKIRDSVDVLLSGKIGPEPTSDEIEKICVDGSDRYSKKIPPGFMDEKKDHVIVFRGAQYSAKFGDLLLWQQTINKAKSDGCKSLIFITDDTKEDWWQIVSGKTIGPLPALKAEMKAAAGVDSFHMYSTESFLRFSEKYLQTQIDPLSISQVAEINEAVKEAQESKNIRTPRLVEEGETYIIQLDNDLSSSDTRYIRRQIQRVVSSVTPEGDYSLYDHEVGFELHTEAQGYDLLGLLLEVPGIYDVRTMPIEWRIHYGSAHQTRYLNFEPSRSHDKLKIYDMSVVLEKADPSQILQTSNWIKMILSKELPRRETSPARKYSVRETPDGLYVNIHIPLEFREAQVIRKRIATLDGILDVRMIDA